ncbi:MAG TPA: nucleotidyltransferase family protein [Bacteroidales bacterium]|nr:nucleotidyltransferase family protein [Bacteroidales bacterium]
MKKKLLLSLCRLEFSVEKKEEIGGYIKKVADWEYLFNAANNHGVIALVQYNIQLLGFLESVPEQQQYKIHSGFLKSVARNALISKIALELDQIAGKENIRVVLLKGLALEKTIFGDKGLRQMTDIDIIVAPEDAMKLRRAMQENGFEAAPFISSIYERKLYVEGKHLPELTKYGIDTEMHTRLFDQKGNSFTESLIERSYPSGLYRNLQYPDPQLHFLYLIKHLCKHESEGSSQLRMYTDLALIAEKDKTILNEDLLSSAESLSLDKSLKSKLQIINDFFDIPVPSFLKENIPGNEDFIKIIRSPGKILSGGGQNIFKPLKYIEGSLNKILFIAGYAFPSGKFLRYRYKNEKRKPLILSYFRWWFSIIVKITG